MDTIGARVLAQMHNLCSYLLIDATAHMGHILLHYDYIHPVHLLQIKLHFIMRLSKYCNTKQTFVECNESTEYFVMI